VPTGYLTTHAIHEFLVLGYKIRKTARNTQKADRTRKLFVQHGSSNYGCAVVPDMAIDGAFDETVKGVSAVAHSASVMSFDKDPSKVIPITVARVTTVLKAAAKREESQAIRLHVTLCGRNLAKAGMKFHIGSSTWNKESVKAASGTPYENGRE
jgi:hypothetical protein